MRRNYVLGNIKMFLLLLGCIYTFISIIIGDYLISESLFLIIFGIDYFSMIFLPITPSKNNHSKKDRKFKLNIKTRYYLFFSISFFMIITFIISLILTIVFFGHFNDSIYVLYSFMLCLLSYIYASYMYRIFILLDLNSYYVRPFIYEDVDIANFASFKKIIKNENDSKWKQCSLHNIKFWYLVSHNNLYLTLEDKEMSKELFVLYYVNLFKELDNFVKENNLFTNEDYNIYLMFYFDDANQVLLRYVISLVKQRNNITYIPCAYVFKQKRLYITRQRSFYKLYKYKKLRRNVLKLFNCVR